jgi:hypothetical protein
MGTDEQSGDAAHGLSVMVAACPDCGLHHTPGTVCPVVTRLPVRAAGTTLPPHAMLAGRFEILAVTHCSAMSTVYHAIDRRQGSTAVAVKQTSVDGLTPAERAEASGWLAREAGLLSSLRNRHLPDLIAAFSEGDTHYVVMPYLRGETVRERVQRAGPLAEIVAVRWARVLADILAYLHSQDPPIIHRDLKPDNVLILPDGELVLLDLGVARPLARGIAGTAIGTPGYAPPEQYQGLADERSDVYALGATLHYMLTGYDADQHAPFRHPRVRQVRADVGRAADELVARLLRLAPAQRPDSAVASRRLDDIAASLPYGVAQRLYTRAAVRDCGGVIVLTVLAAGLAAISGAGVSLVWTLLPAMLLGSAIGGLAPLTRHAADTAAMSDTIEVEQARWRIRALLLGPVVCAGAMPFVLVLDGGSVLSTGPVIAALWLLSVVALFALGRAATEMHASAWRALGDESMQDEEPERDRAAWLGSPAAAGLLTGDRVVPATGRPSASHSVPTATQGASWGSWPYRKEEEAMEETRRARWRPSRLGFRIGTGVAGLGIAIAGLCTGFWLLCGWIACLLGLLALFAPREPDPDPPAGTVGPQGSTDPYRAFLK